MNIKPSLIFLFFISTLSLPMDQDQPITKKAKTASSAPAPQNHLYNYEVFKARIKIEDIADQLVEKSKKTNNQSLAWRNIKQPPSRQLQTEQGIQFLQPAVGCSGIFKTPWGTLTLLCDDIVERPLQKNEALLFLQELQNNGVVLTQDGYNWNIIQVNTNILPLPILKRHMAGKPEQQAAVAAEWQLTKRYTTEIAGAVYQFIPVTAIAQMVADYVYGTHHVFRKDNTLTYFSSGAKT